MNYLPSPFVPNIFGLRVTSHRTSNQTSDISHPTSGIKKIETKSTRSNYTPMIVINKGTNNLVIFTLKEKTSRPNPNYLFEFINSQTRESVTCIATDGSEYPERFNSFEIVEIADPSPLLSEIELSPEGFWEYNVYAQDSTTNLTPANADELVETGLAYVVGTTETTYTYNQQPANAFVYNG